jgi:hypothetical protein
MIMGGVYLTYSAYFLSVDFEVIYIIMNILLLLVYLALAFTYGRNCKANMGSINAYLEEMDHDEDEEVNDIDASLKIKYTMLK